MGRIILAFAIMASVATGAASGHPCRDPQGGSPAPEIVRKAQRFSFWGENPKWLDWAGEEAFIQRLRDSGFAYCYRDGAIEPSCASEQDEAVHAVVLLLMASEAQREMDEKSRLTFEQRWVAEHPEIVRQVRFHCLKLYQDHGGEDARILSACLGNLPAFSPLIPLPVD